MSSISKSIASPMRTLWRRPSSTTSIGARSTPSISPMSGAKPCHRAALLPAEDGRELLHLLVCRALVDEHAETPVALGHDLRRVRDRGDLETAHVRALDLALADVEDERDATVVVRRAVVEREVARAHEIAGTRLHVAALEIPGHTDLLHPPTGRRDCLPTTGACQPGGVSVRECRSSQLVSYSSWRRTQSGLVSLSSRPLGVRSSRA